MEEPGTLNEKNDEEYGDCSRGLVEEFYEISEGIFCAVCSSQSSFLLALNFDKSICLAGKCALTVLSKANTGVELNGYVLTSKDGTQHVFSIQRHSALFELRAMKLDDVRSSSALRNNNFPGDVLVRLDAFENEWTQALRFVLGEEGSYLGRKVTNLNMDNPYPKVSNVGHKLGFSLYDDLHRHLKLKQGKDWLKAIDTLTGETSKRVCIFGGKGVGKSTFSKWLVNKFLFAMGERKKILFIDMDPGQTEFNPPGVISTNLIDMPILGPNFTHLKKTYDKAIFVEDVNVGRIPLTYMKAAIELIKFAEANFSEVPWVINTMGFTQGLGKLIATSLIKIVRPTALIQITSKDLKKSFSMHLTAENVQNSKDGKTFELSCGISNSEETDLPLSYSFIKLLSATDVPDELAQRRGIPAVQKQGISPKNLRMIVMSSYFSEAVYNSRVHVLHLERVSVGLFVGTLPRDKELQCYEKNIIALCFSHDVTPGQWEKVFLDPHEIAFCDFIGYALVLKYDTKLNTLHVLTPIDTEALSRVNLTINAKEVGFPTDLLVNFSERRFASPHMNCALDSISKKYYVPKKAGSLYRSKESM